VRSVATEYLSPLFPMETFSKAFRGMSFSEIIDEKIISLIAVPHCSTGNGMRLNSILFTKRTTSSGVSGHARNYFCLVEPLMNYEVFV
jgi:hypothetical protein